MANWAGKSDIQTRANEPTGRLMRFANSPPPNRIRLIVPVMKKGAYLETLNVVTLLGSLRKGSFNGMVARAA